MTAGDLFLLVLIVFGAMVLGAPIALITLAAGIYAWTHAYPWLKMVGKWAAKPANFVALLAVFILVFLIVLALVVLIHPVMLILLLPALIILFPVDLAIIVWIVRVVKFLFTRLSGFIDAIFLAARLEFIKLKIKTDALKEGGSKGKLGALKSEFSSDARVVTGRVSRKKESGFRGKLDALRGEFSSDVGKVRGKLSKKK